jgi:hypothetical protein
MTQSTAPTSSSSRERKKGAKGFPLSGIYPWKLVLLAAAPVGLSWLYLTNVAPAEVPVPQHVKVPFPAVLPYLEGMILWCAEHPFPVACIGLALLAAGPFFNTTRYYIGLAIVVSLSLGFTYLNVSAPIERLLRAVEEKMPEDRQLPDYLPAKKKQTE